MPQVTTPGNKGLAYTRSQALDFTTYYYETSQHKPQAYGVYSANFDGAGGSYGTCQFNWKTGDLQPIFKDLINNHAGDVAAAFTATADYNTFVDVVMNRTTADQIAWGDSITIYDANGKATDVAKDPWKGYFTTLGTFASCQAAQENATLPYYNQAEQWAGDFGLWSRRGYSLCFDMAVQAGGMTTQCHTDIMNFIASLPTNLTPEVRELRVMRYFAIRRSQDVTSSFAQSFQDRKMAIANGSGTVYGGPVTTLNNDLILEPNGLLAIPAGKIPHFLRGFRTKGK